ncbi:hypothetical protein LSO9J_130025 [Candidatus Liberibacter solanacearum]
MNALALPELTTNALAIPCGKFVRQKSTGADGQRERVKTPATDAGLSNNIKNTSSRPTYLMPKEAVDSLTPFIGRGTGVTRDRDIREKEEIGTTLIQSNSSTNLFILNRKTV